MQIIIHTVLTLLTFFVFSGLEKKSVKTIRYFWPRLFYYFVFLQFLFSTTPENFLMRGREWNVARRFENCECEKTFPKLSRDISSGLSEQVIKNPKNQSNFPSRLYYLSSHTYTIKTPPTPNILGNRVT